MNYLGHAYLSFNDAGVLTGNMIADHVKGRNSLTRFPEKIKEGILLHRRIDEFTDAHAALSIAADFFRPVYGLYSKAIIDTLADHFLANDKRYFDSEKTLLDFTEDVYSKLAAHTEYFPPVFAGYFPYMQQYNWLYNYRTKEGMQRALNGLYRRAAYMQDPAEAYRIFSGNYIDLQDCYYSFIDDMISFVKKESKAV